MKLALVLIALIILVSCTQETPEGPAPEPQTFIDVEMDKEQDVRALPSGGEDDGKDMPQEFEQGCIQINQAYIDKMEAHALFAKGCVEIAEDVSLSDIIVIRGSVVLDCNGHTLNGVEGKIGIRLEDESQAVNCTVNGAQNGFELYDKAVARKCTANNSHGMGFYQRGSSSVVDCLALGNAKHGFFLEENASVADSTARFNGRKERGYGFLLSQGSTAHDIKGNDNRFGAFVDSHGQSASIIDGEFCNNDEGDIIIKNGYVKGNFRVSTFSGEIDENLAVIIDC